MSERMSVEDLKPPFSLRPVLNKPGHEIGVDIVDSAGNEIAWLCSRPMGEHFIQLLAASPPDDAEPITAEWLERCGGERGGTNTYRFRSRGAGPVFELCIDLISGCDGCSVAQKVGGIIYYVQIKMPETRRDLRNLAAALGVVLKEGE